MTTSVELQLAAALRQAASLYESGQWAHCEQVCAFMLNLRPDHFEALNLSGIVAAQSGRLDDAARRLGRAIAVKPGDAAAHNNYGLVLLATGRPLDALACFTRALELQSDYADAYNNRGNALRELGRWDEALQSYEHAIALQPDNALAHNNRGLALHHLKRTEEALVAYECASRLAPQFADPYCNRGDALHALGRLDEALRDLDRALVLSPDFADALNNRGTVLLDLRRPAEALATFDQALQLTPGSADAHNNRGNALQVLSRLPEAVASYDRALEIKAEFVAAHYNRANALARVNRLEEAVDSYGRALAVDPGYPYALGTWLFCKARLCDWRDWDSARGALADAIGQGKAVVKALHLQALSASEALLRRAAEIEVRHDFPRNSTLATPSWPSPGDKIRVGYFSADFRVHPVGILTAEVFARHDRSRFDIVAFSSGPNTGDEQRRRLEPLFDRFIDVRQKSDLEIATLARQLKLDIAVDLSGLTDDARPGVFALRAAPVQVGMIGFAGTLTPDLVDYLVADLTVIPPGSRHHYGEKLVYLPHSYLVNDTTRPISDRRFSRSELGLPEAGFVFCCFNNSYKLSPAVFGCWMRVLARVPGSVLWLANGPSAMVENLRREAELRGVRGDRLVFAERLPSLPEHLARHRAADLALDTLPFNGHTTTIDALWAGLPVVTCTGTTFPGRVATSLLRAIGLPDLVTVNLEQYEDLAVGLASDPERLSKIRRTLGEHRLTTPLFDTATYTRNLEAAYLGIHQRRLAGLAADDLYPGVNNS